MIFIVFTDQLARIQKIANQQYTQDFYQRYLYPSRVVFMCEVSMFTDC